MKNLYFVLIIVLMAGIMLLPLTAVSAAKENVGGASSGEKKPITTTDSFLIYDPESKEVSEVPAADYVFGVVAAEMPASYQPEALKAQAVAAYTYACYKRQSRIDTGGKYDLSADSSDDQGFLSTDKLTEKWGDKAGEYTEKITAAVSEVLGYMITYEGKPVFAAYHAISGGKTESAGNVWTKDYPYLKPVDSVGDLLCPTYLSEATFSAEDFAKAAASLCNLTGDPSGWIGEPQRSDSGTVLSYPLGGTKVTGKKMREAFSLRSANFDLTFANGTFTFTVRGYGHGVGMSQYGANYMALQGNTFIEILAWYYTGCTLEKTD